MKFFEKLKKKEGATPVVTQTKETVNTINLNMEKPGILNLQKNDILDLTKVDSPLSKIKVGAGWDINVLGQPYDLDLCAMLVDNTGKLIKGHNACVYFGSMQSKGIYLDGDNMTGEGEGDDETIFVTLDQLPANVEKIIFYVVIYKGAERKQYFSKVKNAFVRLVDLSDGQENELCRFNLTDNGNNDTAVEFCELHRVVGGWEFQAIGHYKRANITEIKSAYN